MKKKDSCQCGLNEELSYENFYQKFINVVNPTTNLDD